MTEPVAAGAPLLSLPRALLAGFGPDLAARVDAFLAALDAHRLTVDEPAPVEAPLVEAIARAGGLAAVVIVDDEAPTGGTPTAPASVTNWQARAELLARPGPPPFATLFDAVDAALRAPLPAEASAADRAAARVGLQAWEYANNFARGGALVGAMAARLGLGDAELDELFRNAAAREA